MAHWNAPPEDILFLCGVITLSYIMWCSFTTCSLSARGKLAVLLVCHRTVSMAAVYLGGEERGLLSRTAAGNLAYCLSAEDKIWSGQTRSVFSRHSSWRLTCCEWTTRNMKKSWRHTGKMYSRGWCISMCHVIGFKQTYSIKNVTLKAAKTKKETFWVTPSTGKSNN